LISLAAQNSTLIASILCHGNCQAFANLPSFLLARFLNGALGVTDVYCLLFLTNKNRRGES
jgi:hypothetical protein